MKYLKTDEQKGLLNRFKSFLKNYKTNENSLLIGFITILTLLLIIIFSFYLYDLYSGINNSISTPPLK